MIMFEVNTKYHCLVCQIVQVEYIVWMEERVGNMEAIIPVTAPLDGKENHAIWPVQCRNVKKLVKTL